MAPIFAWPVACNDWAVPSARICILLLLLTVSPSVSAQEHAPLTGDRMPDVRGFVSAGYDSTWVSDVGGSLVLMRPSPRASIGASLAVRLPVMMIPELDSVGASVGPGFSFVSRSGLGLTTRVTGGIRTASDDTGKKIALRLGSALAGGYFAPRFSVASELGLVTTFATHITHSEAVRDLFRDRYPEGQSGGTDGPKDGWYALTAHELRAGVLGGVRFTDRFALYGTAGWRFRNQVGGITANPPITALPFFVQVGGELSW